MTRNIFIVLLTLLCTIAHAQPTDDLPTDPGVYPVTISKVQDLHFGAFSVTGSGGTITISNTGVRSATGGVTLLNMGLLFHHSIFDIEAPEQTIITIINGPTASLPGSNGGSVSLELGACSPASPFTSAVAPPGRTAINIGGTLTIGTAAASPPGQYSGSFEVTVNYE